MPESTNRLSKFWRELQRRRVVRVIIFYTGGSFVILQLVEILAPSLRLPEWTMNFILVLLIVGFIIAVILSWIYDVTPKGIEKTGRVNQSKKNRKDNSQAEAVSRFEKVKNTLQVRTLSPRFITFVV